MNRRSVFSENLSEGDISVAITIEAAQDDEAPFLVMFKDTDHWLPESDVKTLIRVLQESLKERKRLTS